MYCAMRGNGLDARRFWHWCEARGWRVGGKLVRDYLKPGFTHNGKTKYSFTYDVTHLMKTGKSDANTFAAQVSSGWWRDKIVNFFGKKSAFRAQLILRYADGTETVYHVE